MHYLILYIIHDKQVTTGLPWLTHVVFDPALIYLDIYFINVVNPIAEKGGAEVSMQWGLFTVTRSERKQANRNPNLSRSCPSHGTHDAITLATGMERVKEGEFSKLSLDGLFMSSNLVNFLELKENTKTACSVTSPPHVNEYT